MLASFSRICSSPEELIIVSWLLFRFFVLFSGIFVYLSVLLFSHLVQRFYMEKVGFFRIFAHSLSDCKDQFVHISKQNKKKKRKSIQSTIIIATSKIYFFFIRFESIANSIQVFLFNWEDIYIYFVIFIFVIIDLFWWCQKSLFFLSE